jgi:4-hydroxybenzoate polyprenyltransferase
MRPANIITSVSDVLAGVAISGFLFEATFQTNYTVPLALLCISTMGLYGGGVVFNDVFDQALDKAERPERPIPRGVVTIKEARGLGILLLFTGIITALLVSNLSGLLAMSIVIAALLYNKFSKHHPVLGPLNMGLCRGLNLLLGISIITAAVSEWWFLGFVPVIYIAAITMISRGEVHGGRKDVLLISVFLYLVVIACFLYFSFVKEQFLYSMPFILAFAWMIFTPLVKAVQNPEVKNIRKSVKAGVIAIILLNASWAAVFGMLFLALVVALLLPLSLYLAKLFAVT